MFDHNLFLDKLYLLWQNQHIPYGMEATLNKNLSKRELLRKKRLEEKRRKTHKMIVIALAVLALIATIILLPNIISQRSTSGDSRGFSLGNPNAPVSVVNFSSYNCVFCAEFSATTEKDLINNYVETGHVYYRYINLAHSDPASQNAAKASYCAADQNLFFEYKTYLYGAAGVQDGFSTNNLVSLAADAGLDGAAFETCLEDGKYTDAPTKDLRYAQSIGVTGTPTFLIDGQLVSSREVIPLIDSLLER